MEAYLYPISLAVISAAVALAERLWPWRPQQRQLRPGLLSDLAHLVFNGHFLGITFYGLGVRYALPILDSWLKEHGLWGWVYRGAASSWPVWVQILAALLVTDFIHWCVHNMLHRVPFLWETHKVHHSIQDGEMDWIVAFRFQWTEVAIYKVAQYLPLAFFGFGWEAVMVHAIFGTLIGHLNHANLNLSYGPLRYLLNSPRMHIWHHNYDGDEKTTVNFGVIFSVWDWIFGTAHMPDAPPKRLGFPGVEEFPRGFLAQEAWPAQRALPAGPARRYGATLLGATLLGVAWWFATR